MQQGNPGQANNGNVFFLPQSDVNQSNDNISSGLSQALAPESLDPLPLQSLFQLLNPPASNTLEPDPLPPAPGPLQQQQTTSSTSMSLQNPLSFQSPLLPDCSVNAGLLQPPPAAPDPSPASFQQISATLLSQLPTTTQPSCTVLQQQQPQQQLPPAQPKQQQRPPAPPPAALVVRQQQLPQPQSSIGNLKSVSGSRRVYGERSKFLLFIKVLLKRLSQDPRLRQRVKMIVSECTRRNRMGDVNYSPLQEAVERRLRGIVGDDHWMRARRAVDTFVQRNNGGLTEVASV